MRTDGLVFLVVSAVILLMLGQGMIQWRITYFARETKMALETLKEAIEHATSVQQAAIVLIRELAQKLNDLAQHPDAEEIRRLATELRSRADELAGAIAEHEEDGEPEDAEAKARRKK